jgi:PAS domain S-box-containing protein
VFGLGCILCEILTFSPPYRAGTFSDTWRQAANGDTAAVLARLDACGGAEPLVRLAHLESGQRRAEEQLVRFFDLSVDLFCNASLSGYFRRVNGNFVRVLGYPESTLLQHRFLEFVHPDDREATLSEVAGLSRGETTIQFRNRYRRVDGDYAWLEWNARAVPEEGVIYAVARDVTALTRDRQVELLIKDRDALRARVDTLERLLRGGGA